jgi:hypothetical protein
MGGVLQALSECRKERAYEHGKQIQQRSLLVVREARDLNRGAVNLVQLEKKIDSSDFERLVEAEDGTDALISFIVGAAIYWNVCHTSEEQTLIPTGTLSDDCKLRPRARLLSRLIVVADRSACSPGPAVLGECTARRLSPSVPGVVQGTCTPRSRVQGDCSIKQRDLKFFCFWRGVLNTARKCWN